MNVARILLPGRVRRSYTAKLGTMFALAIVVTVLFGAAVVSELAVAVETGEAAAVYEVAVSGILGLILFTAVNLGLIAATVGGNTAISLSTLSRKALQMGEGDLDVDLDTRRRDEIGDLYAAFDEMRTSLRESLRETEAARREAESAREEIERESETLKQEAERFSRVMAACADGDLTRRLEAESGNEAMEEVATSFNEMMDRIEALVGRIERFATAVSEASRQVRSDAQQVMDASEEVSGTIQDISDGANEQTEDIQEIAMEMEDISATTEQMAASADEVANTSQSAASAGEAGRETAK